ncbi:protein kinase [Intrasporangium calvum]|uniref:non-specific serine/threonine protein kinase n=1 Tax=Intrasporangium calvum TaxID=53358 RepID=A0ABT5GHC1_9MICO|nr:protein kinase [Intrasporangium calvum]MDC5697316.1 protein kinase [Intrasporangium calvum]
MEAGHILAGRYVVDRAIGAGGMGQVFAGTDRVLQRAVAIKVCPFAPDDTVGFERFRREAQAAASLSHPNVVLIHDAGADGSLAYIVMELLPGPDLARHVADRGALPEAQAVTIATQVAAGLAAAHEVGIVHRDIKPANIVFDGSGSVRVVDFGIARLEEASGLTGAHTVLGSAPYLAPEQAAGRAVDARADLYALGCVLMTMLTGHPPFDGDQALAIAHQHLSADPPRVSDRRPTVDPGLDRLVAELLAKDPAARPSSAREVVERLRRLAAIPRLSAAGDLAATRVLPVTDATVPMATPRHGSPRPSRRSAWPVVAALLLLAVVAGVFWLSWGGPDEPPATATATAPTSQRSVPSPTTPTPTEVRGSEPPAPPVAGEGPRAAAARAVEAVRGVISTVETFGGLEEKAADDLGKRLDDLAKQLARDNEDQLGKKFDDLEKRLEDLADKGDLSETGHDMISAALEALEGLI